MQLARQHDWRGHWGKQMGQNVSDSLGLTHWVPHGWGLCLEGRSDWLTKYIKTRFELFDSVSLCKQSQKLAPPDGSRQDLAFHLPHSSIRAVAHTHISMDVATYHHHRALPSLHVQLPHHLSTPSPRTSPCFSSRAFPLEMSPVHHRLPPLHSFVRPPQMASSPMSPFQHHAPFGAQQGSPFGIQHPSPREDMHMESPRFHFPALPSLKETLRRSPNTASNKSPTKCSGSIGVKLCGVAGCEKRAKAGGVCIAHGGGIRCSKEGCTKHAVSLGFCISHGGGKRCTAEGCQNASRKFGVCWSHGGKRMCLVQGCTKGPKTGGYCWAHGGKMPKK
ncbi:Aste57867_14350 [Aphanomyces stellatus]|uniref:Aste57867_14350 protein n=1 Tax=Aphanomyces stellatus TaxID=120398 RepID=A0A485L1I2_9STRA|nr:hypothetical protein As57867_014296 [Aphanomyces stellatus]VFT91174.1 Aste57867_14350 [Aphanomyces stellatus]